MEFSELFEKYDLPVPRYTSYPTVPFWEGPPSDGEWFASLQEVLAQKDASWSIYLHIPFCETLCTYCGCNNVITRNHSVESPYVDAVLAEKKLLFQSVSKLTKSPLRQMHLGGGTPTFLSVHELVRIIEELKDQCTLSDSFEGSIEVDPRRTTVEQIKALRSCGFNRISMGVQDFDPETQRLVNRIQPFEITKALTEEARNMGYRSVNFDLIYGLPRQSPESIKSTVQQTLQLRPDRIALYSLAVVPWIKPAQRLFKDDDLPKKAEKRLLYEIARALLLDAGYAEIGMDHFSLPTDDLYRSMIEGRLHRNFMGYVEERSLVMLGFGVSAISETPTCFRQNEKRLQPYLHRIGKGELPTINGHKLNDEDRKQRELILQFMTKMETRLDQAESDQMQAFLQPMIDDGLVEFKDQVMKLTAKGKPFLRNACVALDSRLLRKQPGTRIFSGSI